MNNKSIFLCSYQAFLKILKNGPETEAYEKRVEIENGHNTLISIRFFKILGLLESTHCTL